ncbi:adenosylcobinamide-GDP ribazoletransferase [Tropicimonas sp. IMCC6043]|uniref:adenosylcobinamide-GDP ribazoletransferase n=1 Tax=Tropicimonas sp. IMCC6043 TaxID=2510645 RepID=UPI00101D5A3C|nr:adenosylcobinamide-GDP ribazoletransferase [Tropicimonas sp. IMCC6043]RYH06486.1 adenosylcobinamide-GDP ribazoletransferase [Tropicimonas sp. IMCC6043]
MHETRQFKPFQDLALACALLTRLPVPVNADFAATRGAKAAWAYPLAGALVAALAGGIGWVAIALGMPTTVAAGLVIAGQVVMTGAMHEDGLADAADGLWGGWDRARRLEIMKDSRIGSYGVLALILSLGLRWSALASLGPALLPFLVAAALLSRSAMVWLMWALPNAREGGLSRSVGRPGDATVAAAMLIGLAGSLALVGAGTLALLVASAVAALACAAIARARIGGQTGDILGATQQIAEICCLILAAALVN